MKHDDKYHVVIINSDSGDADTSVIFSYENLYESGVIEVGSNAIVVGVGTGSLDGSWFSYEHNDGPNKKLVRLQYFSNFDLFSKKTQELSKQLTKLSTPGTNIKGVWVWHEPCDTATRDSKYICQENDHFSSKELHSYRIGLKVNLNKRDFSESRTRASSWVLVHLVCFL